MGLGKAEMKKQRFSGCGKSSMEMNIILKWTPLFGLVAAPKSLLTTHCCGVLTLSFGLHRNGWLRRGLRHHMAVPQEHWIIFPFVDSYWKVVFQPSTSCWWLQVDSFLSRDLKVQGWSRDFEPFYLVSCTWVLIARHFRCWFLTKYSLDWF